MTMNRITFCLAQGAYFAFAVPDKAALGAVLTLLGLCVTALLFVHLLLGPARSVPRQTAAMVADSAYTGLLMHLGGAEMACWYPCILWIIIGNGFRLGRANLLRATAVGSLAFGAVMLTTPFWHDHLALSVGLLLGNCVLPLYIFALLTRLHAARRDAQAADRTKGLFLASVSHELRTPLHAIIGMGSLLEKADLAPGPAEMARTIMGASRSLLELIEDILRLSRMEIDRPPADAVEFDLPGLLTEVRRLVQAQAHEKGLSVALHVGFGSPLRVRGDERHIREVLVNLAGNAVKFTERGGILLAVRALAGGPEGHLPSETRLRFEVADTGIGIAPEAHGRIFEQFTQADNGIGERFGGTGLGLAICKQVVGRLGGTIGVESSPGAGSTFWFEAGCEAVPRDTGQVRKDVGSAAPARVTLLSLDTGTRPALRTAARSLDPEAVIVECNGEASIQAQLAAASAAGRMVLADLPASATIINAFQAGVRTLGPARLPLMLVVGELAGGPRSDLRWVVPTWIPEDLAASHLEEALEISHALSPGKPADGSGTTINPAPPTRRTIDTQEREVGSLRSLSVLVVDDNRTNRQVVAKIVESGGHRYQVADGGQAALEALEAPDGGCIDLVLMDVNMPGIDGLEATKLYRVASLGMPQVPILGLTADASPDMAKRCREAGMVGCVTKPVRAADLLEAIETAAVGPGPRPSGSPPPPWLEGQRPSIDVALIDALRDVVGEAVVADLLEDFISDARRILSEIEQALEAEDSAAFRFKAHALVSTAANIGALRLRQLSMPMERMGSAEMTMHGKGCVRELTREVEAFAAAATRHIRRR